MKALSAEGWIRSGTMWSLVLLISVMVTIPAGTSPDALRAETRYLAAKRAAQEQPLSAEHAWQLGRACFDKAEHARASDDRESLAEEGITTCRRAIRLDPEVGAASYYLALNLGQLARTKGLGALKLVRQMEEHLEDAIRQDPKFDYAGPHRVLGLLYWEAPGWPASVGNKRKAREHLEKAVELAPGYPDNRLTLIEAYLDWKLRKETRHQLSELLKDLPDAQERFSGEQWESAWTNWQARIEKIKREMAK